MMSCDPKRNLTSYRVIYGDTDKMGVVYYANYLRWFELGRSELLRRAGIPYSDIERRGVHFPVAEATCRYFNSARYDDLVTIETRLTAVRRASLTFTYRITDDTGGTLLASGSTKHACVDHRGHIVKIDTEVAGALGFPVGTATVRNES